MSRRNKINKTDIVNIINEELMLTEIFNSEIETEYKIIDYGTYVSYQFKTNSGNEYDLEFHDSEEPNSTEFESGKHLSDYNLTKNKTVKCLDIAFTVSSVQDKENPEEFEKETNQNEYVELFARMLYISKIELLKNKKTKLFVIGNSRRNKNEIYLKIVENNLKNFFHIEKGISIFHSDGLSLFLIRK